MALVKVKNLTKSVLFINSLGVAIRPFKTLNDVILLHEDTVEKDTEINKCILLGWVEIEQMEVKKEVKRDELQLTVDFEDEQMLRCLDLLVNKSEILNPEEERKNKVEEQITQNELKEEKIIEEPKYESEAQAKIYKEAEKAKNRKKGKKIKIEKEKKERAYTIKSIKNNGDVEVGQIESLTSDDIPVPDFIDGNTEDGQYEDDEDDSE